MAIERKLNSPTAPVKKTKKKIAHKRMSAAEKKAARLAYKQYKKRRNTADKKFDLVRAKFRAKKRGGFKNKPGPKLRVAAKVGTVNRKAGALRAKLKKLGKLDKKDSAALKGLSAVAKKKYSANRKRIQAVAKQRAHDIIGKAMVEYNKIMKEAKKSGDKKAIAEATKKAGKILTVAKNQAVRVIQDARRDLTAMRKAAGRNHGGRKPGRKPQVAVAAKGGKSKHQMVDVNMGVRPNRNVRRQISGRGMQIRKAKAAAAGPSLAQKVAARPNRNVRRQISGRGMQIRKARRGSKAMSGVGHTFAKNARFGKLAKRSLGLGAAVAGVGALAAYRKMRKHNNSPSAA